MSPLPQLYITVPCPAAGSSPAKLTVPRNGREPQTVTVPTTAKSSELTEKLGAGSHGTCIASSLVKALGTPNIGLAHGSGSAAMGIHCPRVYWKKQNP